MFASSAGTLEWSADTLEWSGDRTGVAVRSKVASTDFHALDGIERYESKLSIERAEIPDLGETCRDLRPWRTFHFMWRKIRRNRKERPRLRYNRQSALKDE